MERVEVLEREEDVRDWLTSFDKLSLFSNAALEPNAEYYLRVRARTTPRNAAFVWPWHNSDVAGLAKFTFLGEVSGHHRRDVGRPALPARSVPERQPAQARRPFRDNPRLILLGMAALLIALVAMVTLADRSAELNPDFLTEVVLYALSAADLTMLLALVVRPRAQCRQADR